MAGLPDKSGRNPKFKEAFTIGFWQPLSLQHLLPFLGTFEDVQVEVGVGVGVTSVCENPPHRGPVSQVYACHVSSCASSSSSACLRVHPPRYTVSLSLLPLNIFVYISMFSARLPSNVSAKINQRQVQS
jgi:hypothetical protein